MEVADCALSDQIEKFETEIDFGNEKFHFDAIFMKKMIKGTLKIQFVLSKTSTWRDCVFGWMSHPTYAISLSPRAI